MRNLALYIKAFLDRYIYFVPIIMLLATLGSNFIDYNYVVVGNVLGYSLLSNLAMYYFFNFKGNYCWFTKNAPIGLILINIIDIFGTSMSFVAYSRFFNIVVCCVVIILALIFKLKTDLRND